MSLTAPPEVATPGNEQACQHDNKDRGEARAERGPVNIDQREPVVGLVEANVAGFVRLVVLDVEGGVIGHLDGWGRRGGDCLLGEVLLDQLLLVVLVDDVLPVADEERGHVVDD